MNVLITTPSDICNAPLHF